MKEQNIILKDICKYVKNYYREYNREEIKIAESYLEKAWMLMKKLDSLGKLDLLAQKLKNEDNEIRLGIGILLMQSKEYRDTAYQALDDIVESIPLEAPVRMPAVGLTALYRIDKDRISRGEHSIIPTTVS